MIYCEKEESAMNCQPEAMRTGKTRFLIYVLSMLGGISCFTAYAQVAQKDQGDTHSEVAIMQQLLLEVRQLRQAVEHGLPPISG